MRELIGKIPTKDPDITEVVYLSEIVRCLECEQTVPIGIEVVTVKKKEGSKKVVRHVFYCRGHGFDYEARAQSLPIRRHAQSEPLLHFNNPAWGRI
jgi:CO dehydrogenase/acetyl-CoA synthase alpha subunit